jgi:ATP-binding cassette subfamily B protein
VPFSGSTLLYTALKYKVRLALIVFALLLEVGFNALIPLSLQRMIDDGLRAHDYRAMVLVVATLGVAAIVVSTSGIGRDYLFSSVKSSFLSNIRDQMFDRVQRMSIASHAKLDSGEALSRFSTDLAAVDNAIGMAIPWGIQPGLEALLSAILLFALDWRLACVAVFPWPFVMIAPHRLARPASRAADQRMSESSHFLGGIAENLGAQPVIKAFNLQNFALEQFRAINRRVTSADKQAGFLGSLMERSATSGILVMQVVILAAGARMAFYGSISLGTFVAFQGLLVLLGNSLLYVMQYSPNILQVRTSLSRIRSLLEQPLGVVDDPDAVALPDFRQAIEFDHVDFSYDGSRLNLAGLQLRIPCGANVAFVGSSGSGKSTALSLLMRFYDPTNGLLRIDGLPLRSITQESLRASIGVVFQDSFLFDTSIRENIRAGNRAATDAEIEHAAREAEIHEAIAAMPAAYDTLVGAQGGKLSVGQRQRIAIARAILKNPRILLLDEATSALDPVTEATVNDTLQKLGKDRTVISVTHRLASATGADAIFVFAEGRMIESGTHSLLVAAGGAYARLWAKQSGFVFTADRSRVSVSAERLSAIPILAGLEPEPLEALGRMCVQYTFRAYTDVFRQGDYGDKFYMIARGRFHVIQDDRTIATLEDGDCFGEIALVTDQPRNATVRCVQEATCLVLDRPHFQELLRSSAAAQERIRLLVQRRTVGA